MSNDEARERVARVISPEWFGDGASVLSNYPDQHLHYQQMALAKADAILALLPPVVEGGVIASFIRDQVQWYTDRFEEVGHSVKNENALINALTNHATEREAAARAAGIAEGMERAAGIAEGHDSDGVLTPGWPDGAMSAARQIATAIRAAIPQGTGEGSGDA